MVWCEGSGLRYRSSGGLRRPMGHRALPGASLQLGWGRGLPFRAPLRKPALEGRCSQDTIPDVHVGCQLPLWAAQGRKDVPSGFMGEGSVLYRHLSSLKLSVSLSSL